MSSMTMIVVVESESDKPTGWGVEKLRELNDNSKSMYSEIKHSLDNTIFTFLNLNSSSFVPSIAADELLVWLGSAG